MPLEKKDGHVKKIYGFPHIIVFLTLLFSLNLISLFFHRSSSFIAPLLSPLLFFHRSLLLSPLPSPSTAPLSFLATLSFHHSPLILGYSLLSPLPSPSWPLPPFTAPLSFFATLSFHRSPLLLGYSLLSPLPSPSWLLSPFTSPLSFHLSPFHSPHPSHLRLLSPFITPLNPFTTLLSFTVTRSFYR